MITLCVSRSYVPMKKHMSRLVVPSKKTAFRARWCGGNNFAFGEEAEGAFIPHKDHSILGEWLRL